MRKNDRTRVHILRPLYQTRDKNDKGVRDQLILTIAGSCERECEHVIKTSGRKSRISRRTKLELVDENLWSSSSKDSSNAVHENWKTNRRVKGNKQKERCSSKNVHRYRKAERLKNVGRLGESRNDGR